ncbi:hypothetical protein PLESTM_001741600 [Pleodorina starrii]|nr:hypothetical protein PLESTM_001741600 [Pleodorina starrii]
MQCGALGSCSRAPTIGASRTLRPVAIPPTLYVGHPGLVITSHQQQQRSSIRVRSSIEFVEGISKEEAAKFDRIAASLVARLSDVQDYVEDDLPDGDDDDDNLLPFGASPAEVAARQARIAQRRSSGAAGSSSSSGASSSGGGLRLADGPNGYVPRSKRRRQIPDENLPKVAIVGRPNVGKSAMFNRIAGAAVAVVYDQPGVTRDRLYTRAFWGDKEFIMIDTGGLMSDATRLPPDVRKAAMKSISAEGLPEAIERQAAAGVAEADSVVLLVDGQAGLQAGDEEILSWLRSNHPSKPVLLAVNKCENSAKADQMVADFWITGLEPHAVSAITGTGTGEMLDALVGLLPPPTGLEQEDAEDKPLAVAIVGRPNVGKSSLLNAIAGEERSIVCDLSGTTRDAVDTRLTLPGGQRLTLIDTAGIRKRSRLADSPDGAEQLSVDRAMRAVRRADVAVLVVDAVEGVTQQDFRLSELFASEGKAVVVVVNKWDRVDPRIWSVDKMAENVRTQLRHVSWASVVCTSAVNGRHVDDVLEAVLEAGEQHRRRVPTATLNMVLREATQWKAPPTQRGSLRKGRIYYATQAGTRPPSFVFFVNDEKLFPDDYRRYMERQLRDNIGFPGSPMRLFWRGKPKREPRAKPPASAASSSGAASGGAAAGGRRGGKN